ncbi:cytochrome P450 3A30-like [Protopterus annectens]|uniref:cytochrome P450 3A30-like n=1 Tax=Protopterus annectens TaxID=7888 RepID=UPI001CFC07C1|nr:cytochrome P450 3A30-like [Protopterus annectens]
MEFSLETWTLLITFTVLLLVYGVWPYNFFKKLNIPGPTPFPFIGTFHHLRKGFFNFDLECMQKYGQIWGFYDGRQPVIGLVDTSMIKTIWVKECYSTFTNRRNFRLNGKLDTGLNVVEDEQWKRIRSVLSPNFTSGRLKEMLPIMKQHRDVLIKNLQKKANANEPVQLKEFFGAYSLDVIGSTSFSVDIDSLNHPNEPFVVHMKKALKFSFFNPLLIVAVIFPWIIPVLEKMDFTLFPHDTVNFFANAVKSIKEKKKKGDSNERVDFLQMMMDSQLSDKNLVSNGVDHTYKALTDDEIVAQSVLFIIAGYETTSTALTYLAYNLALHPDEQQKLQQEIDDTFPDKASLTYDGLMQMEYLDMVINESMRLYPNGGRTERISSKTVEINGVTIPKGTVIMVPLYALHRHPNHWPDPEEFRPERFSKENRETMDPYAYMPFGTGPRNCIGMRFALLNMKLALTSVLQNFSFEPCKETQIPLKISPMGLMTPEPPVILRLVPRPNAKTVS